MNASSYTSANSLPAKLFKWAGVLEKGLIPLHPQFSPTNKCNLNCSFCSCAGRAKNQEMPWDTAEQIITELVGLGAKGVTITGGGEPLLYRHINQVLGMFLSAGVKVGLVTNGLLLSGVDPDLFGQITWCRVSCSDDRDVDALRLRLENAVVAMPDVDWALSYVVTDKPNPDKIRGAMRMANDLEMTHIRFVSDIFQAGEIGFQRILNDALRGMDIGKAIIQPRASFTKGTKRCLIPLVKPFYAADGQIYPCCGVQYALETPSKDFEPSMSMGDNLTSLIQASTAFDGSKCVKCYYEGYNQALAAIIDPVQHKEFV